MCVDRRILGVFVLGGLGALCPWYGVGMDFKTAAQLFGALLLGAAGNLAMELARNNDST